MSITRAQVADLQPGDVVELRHRLFPEITLRGPVAASGTRDYDLVLPPVWIRERSGGPAEDTGMWAELTVVSRAPRPLYVNHPRTEPADHDVVLDGEGAIRHCDAKGFGGKPTWWSFEAIAGCKWTHTTYPPQPLTLLVDGTTGQVVTS